MTPTLTCAAISAMNADVRRWGKAGVETGGFLLGEFDSAETSAVALAGTKGVARAAFQFTISGLAIDRLSEWAEDRRLYVRAQFHSHRRGTVLSPIDRAGGIRVEGFISTVIPGFLDPPQDPERWGWWRFGAGEWQASPPPDVSPGGVQIVTFDEDGIRE